MKIKNLEFSKTLKGEPIITATIDKSFALAVQKLIDEYTPEKPFDMDIYRHIEKRSNEANAYFHLLNHQIAVAMNIGNDESKVRLVLEYGAIKKRGNGKSIGLKYPSDVDINEIYKYAKWFDTRTEDGEEFNCYIIYERTHNLNSKQMARLIDGTVFVAQGLTPPIDTRTPVEIARMISLMQQQEDKVVK